LYRNIFKITLSLTVVKLGTYNSWLAERSR